MRLGDRLTTARMLWALGALGTSLPLALYLWGFSVDDAWIVARVARMGLTSGVLSFNPGGFRTDAVTPLGYAELVVLVTRLSGANDPLFAARVLGALTWLGCLGFAAWLGLAPPDRPGRLTRPQRVLLWAVTAGASPSLAAWAGAGLETPLVALACTLGVGLAAGAEDTLPSAWRRWRFLGAGGCLGAAAAWRPELTPFGLAAILAGWLSERRARGDAGQRSTLAAAAVAFALPIAACVAWRVAHFGSPVPLAALAKAPDLASGLRYVLGAALLCGPLWLGWTLAGTRPAGASVVLWPLAAHAAALLLAGGDWMPFYRLWVPVLPGLVGLSLARVAPSKWTLLGGVLSLASSALLVSAHGEAARSVVSRREQLTLALRPHLAKSRRIATVDIGWVGAATDRTVVDLAGVTDPSVARLPGGHTSKRIAPGFFSARDVDTWVIRASDREHVVGEPLGEVHAVYVVDQRLLARAEDLSFVSVAVLPLAGTSEQYVVAVHAPAR